ncbi:MAG TPA: sigma-70 family RNA polymerase sigma factor [Rhodanobacteraceae bacterium]
MTDGPSQRRFAALWQEHQGIVSKIAWVYARSGEDRRELAQDIGMQLWRSFAGFDARRAKFSTWMYRVALNVAISWQRQSGWQGEGRLESLDARHLETIGGGADIVEPDARLEALHAFIEQLGRLDRALIVLYLEDRSHADMADILGISKTNVATRIGRIKQKLREQLTDSTGACHGTR